MAEACQGGHPNRRDECQRSGIPRVLDPLPGSHIRRSHRSPRSQTVGCSPVARFLPEIVGNDAGIGRPVECGDQTNRSGWTLGVVEEVEGVVERFAGCHGETMCPGDVEPVGVQVGFDLVDGCPDFFQVGREMGHRRAWFAVKGFKCAKNGGGGFVFTHGGGGSGALEEGLELTIPLIGVRPERRNGVCMVDEMTDGGFDFVSVESE